MIKTLISGGIILSLIGGLLVPDLVIIILRTKGEFLLFLSNWFSQLAITVIFFEIAFGVGRKILKSL